MSIEKCELIDITRVKRTTNARGTKHSKVFDCKSSGESLRWFESSLAHHMSGQIVDISMVCPLFYLFSIKKRIGFYVENVRKIFQEI